MQLLEVTRRLAELPIDDYHLCSAPLWLPALRVSGWRPLPRITGCRRPSTEQGFSYFLEVAVSLEVMGGWHASQPTNCRFWPRASVPSYYATYDA